MISLLNNDQKNQKNHHNCYCAYHLASEAAHRHLVLLVHAQDGLHLIIIIMVDHHDTDYDHKHHLVILVKVQDGLKPENRRLCNSNDNDVNHDHYDHSPSIIMIIMMAGPLQD